MAHQFVDAKDIGHNAWYLCRLRQGQSPPLDDKQHPRPPLDPPELKIPPFFHPVVYTYVHKAGESQLYVTVTLVVPE